MEVPANREIDLSQVPVLGELAFTPVSERYRALRLLTWTLIQLLLTVAVFSPVIIRMFWPDVELPVGRGSRYWLVPVGVQGVLALFWLTEELLGFPRRGYVVRDRDITYRSGWFSRSTVTVPYAQIQHLELTQGVVSRLFHLKHLKLYTAGGSGNLRIAGLEEERAEVLRTVLDTRTGKG